MISNLCLLLNGLNPVLKFAGSSDLSAFTAKSRVTTDQGGYSEGPLSWSTKLVTIQSKGQSFQY